jgi:hypothetical protein
MAHDLLKSLPVGNMKQRFDSTGAGAKSLQGGLAATEKGIGTILKLSS